MRFWVRRWTPQSKGGGGGEAEAEAAAASGGCNFCGEKSSGADFVVRGRKGGIGGKVASSSVLESRLLRVSSSLYSSVGSS